MSRYVLMSVVCFLLACGDASIGETSVSSDGSPRNLPSTEPNGALEPSTEPPLEPAPGVSETFYVTRTTCMRPCAVQLDAQKSASLTWAEVRDSEYVWDFDDGGSRTDADGFLAAVVYEYAGTYRPTVTVDGETWNPQTITVTDPAEVRCVSLSGDWSGCPAGAGHHTSVSSALSGLSGGTHVLFHRGESYGNQNLGGYANVSFGAYGSGAKPAFTWTGSWGLSSAQSIADIQYTTSNSGGGSSGLGMNGDDSLLLRATVTGASTTHGVVSGDSFFIVASNVTGGSYGIFVTNTWDDDGIDYLVVKDSTISRAQDGEHTIRQQGADKALYQNNQIVYDGSTGSKSSMTLRGDSNWALVQGNFMDQTCSVNPEYSGAPGSDDGKAGGSAGQLQRYIVWERNTLDVTKSATQWGMRFVGHDMIVRNNVTYNCSSWHYHAGGDSPISAQNVWFVNNTAFTNKTQAQGVVCSGADCVNKNNLFYSTQSAVGCFSGGTQAKNWCMTPNICVDPVTGGSGCYNPTLVSTSPTSPDFARPGAGARGIDAGDPNVPVWDDFDDVDRTTMDVGAVTR